MLYVYGKSLVKWPSSLKPELKNEVNSVRTVSKLMHQKDLSTSNNKYPTISYITCLGVTKNTKSHFRYYISISI